MGWIDGLVLLRFEDIALANAQAVLAHVKTHPNRVNVGRILYSVWFLTLLADHNAGLAFASIRPSSLEDNVLVAFLNPRL